MSLSPKVSDGGVNESSGPILGSYSGLPIHDHRSLLEEGASYTRSSHLKVHRILIPPLGGRNQKTPRPLGLAHDSVLHPNLVGSIRTRPSAESTWRGKGCW